LEFFQERLHLVAFFYFILIFGFGGGIEIATLSLAMTVFLGYTWLHIILHFISSIAFGIFLKGRQVLFFFGLRAKI